MNYMTKIIIGFAGFVVVAVAILGYGIYRKGSAREVREANEAAAVELCKITPADFAYKPKEQRISLLDKAGRVKAVFEGDDEVEKRLVEDLSAWISTQADLQKQLDQHADKIAKLLAALEYEFPSESHEQLSTRDVQRLEEAAKQANDLSGRLFASVDRRKIDVSGVFQAAVEALKKRGGAVRSEISTREGAYTMFRDDVKSSLDKPRGLSEEEASSIEKAIQKWIVFASRCADKRIVLKVLLDKIRDVEKVKRTVSLSGDAKKLELVQDIIDSMGRLEMAGPTSQPSGAASKLRTSISDLEATDRSWADFFRKVMDRATKGGSADATEQQKLVAKIIRYFRYLKAYAPKPGTTPSSTYMSYKQTLTSDIEKLQELDQRCGAFFAEILAYRLSGSPSGSSSGSPSGSAKEKMVNTIITYFQYLAANKPRLGSSTSSSYKLRLRMLSREIAKLEALDRSWADFFTQQLQKELAGKTGSSEWDTIVTGAARLQALANRWASLATGSRYSPSDRSMVRAFSSPIGTHSSLLNMLRGTGEQGPSTTDWQRIIASIEALDRLAVYWATRIKQRPSTANSSILRDFTNGIRVYIELLRTLNKDIKKPGGVGSSRKSPSGKSLTLNLGAGVTMKLVLIPAGTFTMGSPKTEKGRSADEGPQRRVTITRPFYMGVYEVTQEQYEAVVGKNPARFTGAKNPVESVSWNDAVAFCKALSKKVGRVVRLPTEAEWEYACRAGTKTAFYFGDDEKQSGDYAWYKDNSGGKTHPVGRKKPNAWGLYDMHGNIWEWCGDWYADSYMNAKRVDPQGPASGSKRVVRGGSWNYTPVSCRAAYRSRYSPDFRNYGFGFRVVVSSAGVV